MGNIGANKYSTVAKKAKAQYQKEWRAKHPDSVRESNRRYWEKRAKKQIAESTANAEEIQED